MLTGLLDRFQAPMCEDFERYALIVACFEILLKGKVRKHCIACAMCTPIVSMTLRSSWRKEKLSMTWTLQAR